MLKSPSFEGPNLNRVIHFEIPADNLARAKKFYSTVFGWKINDYPEMQYTTSLAHLPA